MVQTHQIRGAQREQGIGAPLVVAELDLENVRRETFDNGADLPAHQAVLRHVGKQSYDI